MTKPITMPPGARYLRVGVLELLVVLGEGHRLAGLDRIPRRELLQTSFVTRARVVNPEVMAHVHRSLFGDIPHPALVEASDILQTTRLSLVARDDEHAGVALPADIDLHVPGLVFRRVEEPSPTLEYGIVWLEPHASPSVPGFVGVARELAASR